MTRSIRIRLFRWVTRVIFFSTLVVASESWADSVVAYLSGIQGQVIVLPGDGADPYRAEVGAGLVAGDHILADDISSVRLELNDSSVFTLAAGNAKIESKQVRVHLGHFAFLPSQSAGFQLDTGITLTRFGTTGFVEEEGIWIRSLQDGEQLIRTHSGEQYSLSDSRLGLKLSPFGAAHVVHSLQFPSYRPHQVKPAWGENPAPTSSSYLYLTATKWQAPVSLPSLSRHAEEYSQSWRRPFMYFPSRALDKCGKLKAQRDPCLGVETSCVPFLDSWHEAILVQNSAKENIVIEL